MSGPLPSPRTPHPLSADMSGFLESAAYVRFIESQTFVDSNHGENHCFITFSHDHRRAKLIMIVVISWGLSSNFSTLIQTNDAANERCDF